MLEALTSEYLYMLACVSRVRGCVVWKVVRNFVMQLTTGYSLSRYWWACCNVLSLRSKVCCSVLVQSESTLIALGHVM